MSQSVKLVVHAIEILKVAVERNNIEIFAQNVREKERENKREREREREKEVGEKKMRENEMK